MLNGKRQPWLRCLGAGAPRTGRTPSARQGWAMKDLVLMVVLGVVFAVVRDAVTLTGLLGAYAVIVGIYLALAALSARPARTTERSDA